MHFIIHMTNGHMSSFQEFVFKKEIQQISHFALNLCFLVLFYSTAHLTFLSATKHLILFASQPPAERHYCYSGTIDMLGTVKGYFCCCFWCLFSVTTENGLQQCNICFEGTVWHAVETFPHVKVSCYNKETGIITVA